MKNIKCNQSNSPAGVIKYPKIDFQAKTEQTIKLRHATERYNFWLLDTIKNAQNDKELKNIECNQSNSPAVHASNIQKLYFQMKN